MCMQAPHMHSLFSLLLTWVPFRSSPVVRQGRIAVLESSNCDAAEPDIMPESSIIRTYT